MKKRKKKKGKKPPERKVDRDFLFITEIKSLSSDYCIIVEIFP